MATYDVKKNILAMPYVYGNVLSYSRPIHALNDSPLTATEERENTPQPVLRGRRRYRIASFFLTTLILVTAVASLVMGVFVFISDLEFEDSSSDSLLSVGLGILLFIDAPLSVIGMIACISYLAVKPHKLLLQPPHMVGAFACLCVSVIALCLLACGSLAFTIVVHCISATKAVSFMIPLYALLPIRIAALLGFFGVLIANRRLG